MLKQAYEMGCKDALEKIAGEDAAQALGAVPVIGPLLAPFAADEGKALGTYAGAGVGQFLGLLGGAGTGAGLGALVAALSKKSKGLGALIGAGAGGLVGTGVGGYHGAGAAHRSTNPKAPKHELGAKGALAAIPGVGPYIASATAEKGKGWSTLGGGILGGAVGRTPGKALSLVNLKAGRLAKILGGGAGAYLGARYGHGDYDKK